MELSITIIILILYSIFIGAFLPFVFFYLKAFYRKHKSVKQLMLRFVLLFLFEGIIITLLDKSFGVMELITDKKYELWFVIPTNIGLWGGIILFRIGYKRGLKRRALIIQKSE